MMGISSLRFDVEPEATRLRQAAQDVVGEPGVELEPELGSRTAAEVRLGLDPGLAGHALASLAQAGRLGLHVESDGRDPHHVAEAAFKAVGRALRSAVRAKGAGGVPSTKGSL